MLKLRGQRAPVNAPMLETSMFYHYFISHVMSTGQDQARSIKDLLRIAVPDLSIFLDIDDMKDVSNLENEIDVSLKVIVFISASYFCSRNCLRELQHAVLTKNDIILVRETQSEHGAVPLEIAHEQSRRTCTTSSLRTS